MQTKLEDLPLFVKPIADFFDCRPQQKRIIVCYHIGKSIRVLADDNSRSTGSPAQRNHCKSELRDPFLLEQAANPM